MSPLPKLQIRQCPRKDIQFPISQYIQRPHLSDRSDSADCTPTEIRKVDCKEGSGTRIVGARGYDSEVLMERVLMFCAVGKMSDLWAQPLLPCGGIKEILVCSRD